MRCGAYHTLAEAAEAELARTALEEPEVLEPPPHVLCDHSAAANGASDLLPGMGLVESPKVVLRQEASRTLQNTDVFRSLACLFWSTNPAAKVELRPVPKRACLNVAETGAWREALQYVKPRTKPSAVPHPLQRLEPSEEPGDSSVGSKFGGALPVPSPHGMATWDVVDEIVHRTLCGDFAHLAGSNLSAISVDSVELRGPYLQTVAPAERLADTPRGQARAECLSPRPFYIHTEDSPFEPSSPSARAVPPRDATITEAAMLTVEDASTRFP